MYSTPPKEPNANVSTPPESGSQQHSTAEETSDSESPLIAALESMRMDRRRGAPPTTSRRGSTPDAANELIDLFESFSLPSSTRTRTGSDSSRGSAGILTRGSSAASIGVAANGTGLGLVQEVEGDTEDASSPGGSPPPPYIVEEPELSMAGGKSEMEQRRQLFILFMIYTYSVEQGDPVLRSIKSSCVISIHLLLSVQNS